MADGEVIAFRLPEGARMAVHRVIARLNRADRLVQPRTLWRLPRRAAASPGPDADERPADPSVRYVAPHTEVLLAIARPPSDPTSQDRLATALSKVADWQILLAHARDSGLLPLLCLRVAQPSTTTVPEEFRTSCRLFFRNNVVRCLRASAEVARILRSFETQGIRALPFKGPVLALAVYGDVAARQFSDLDILVDPGRVWDAYDLLLADGYSPEVEIIRRNRRRALRRTHEFALTGGPTGARVELHTAFSPPAYQARLSFDRLWAGREAVDLVGAPIATLGPVDSFLMLCLHGAQHEWRRLEHVAAIAYLVAGRTDADWPAVPQLAGDCRCSRRCLVGFALAERMCGLQLPEGVREALDEDRAARRLAHLYSQRLMQGPSQQSQILPALFNFVRNLDSRNQMAAAVARSLFVPGPRDWVASQLPDELMFVHYLVRPFRLVATHGPDRLKSSRERR